MSSAAHQRFVVLGVHRSGASLLTRLLIAAGCGAGAPHRFLPPSEINPLGFFEHRRVHGLNRRLLEALGAAPANPVPALGGIPSSVVDRFRCALRGSVAELDARLPWVMKDPQLSLTLPAWRTVLDDPVCVIALRHPRAVARSLERVGPGMYPDLGLAQWEAYTVAAVNGSAGCRRTLVEHSALLADPHRAVHGLITAVGLDPGRVSEHAITEIVQPALSHVVDARDEDLPAPIAALHDRLRSAGLPPADERLEVSDWSLEVFARHGPPAGTPRPMRRVAVIVDTGLDPVHNRATAMVRRSWGRHDLDRVDVFYSFADPESPGERHDLGAYLPGGLPEPRRGHVIGDGDVIVTARPPSGHDVPLTAVLSSLAYLVSRDTHDAYLVVDPFTHVDLERLLHDVDRLPRDAFRFEDASNPVSETAAGHRAGGAMLLSRNVADHLVTQMTNSEGADDSVGVARSIADWLRRHRADTSPEPLTVADLRRVTFVDQLRRPEAPCHRFSVERVHEAEWFHDLHHAHLDPGYRTAPGVNRAENDLVFVQIPSYRDPELPKTLRSMLDNAEHPERLRIGICWQYDELTAGDLDPWIDDARFRVDEVYYRHALGCSWARSRVNRLYEDEGYALQIDSHMRFAPGWDERLVEMLETIDSPRPVLTTYPPAYRYDEHGREVLDHGTGIQRIGMKELGANLTGIQRGEMTPDPSRPGPSRFLAGGYVFSHGRFVTDVPSDEQTYFDGEELALAARAFTHGYDLFYPNENLIWHLYHQPAPKHWHDNRRYPELRRGAFSRLRTLFTGDHTTLGEYGLGSVRTIADYEHYAGVDFRAARFGLPAPRLGPATLCVDYAELGVVDRDDWREFTIRLHDADNGVLARVTVIDPAVLGGAVPVSPIEVMVPSPISGYSLRAAHSDGSYLSPIVPLDRRGRGNDP